MSKLQGKVAVVTGGTTGIGLATAQRFIEDGAFVFITGRRQAELDQAVEKLGENAFGVQGDVAKNEDLDRLYEAVKEKKGKIDILFANAGVGEFAPIDAVSEQHFDKIFDINVRGVLFTVQKALPFFNDGGSIILNGSIAGSSGMESFSVYCASKAAVRSFARSWILELKGRNIRVNVVSPGAIDTPAISLIAGGEEQAKQFQNMMIPQIPLGRIGESAEIANTVAFLASSESSYINGAEIVADGGAGQY